MQMEIRYGHGAYGLGAPVRDAKYFSVDKVSIGAS